VNHHPGDTGSVKMKQGLVAVVSSIVMAAFLVAPTAAVAAEKDPAWPKYIGWQGCSAPVWSSKLATGEPGNGARVLVIGDSHMRKAASAVKAQLKISGWTPTVRCWGGKRLDWGREQIARAKKLNQLPENVVIALGTNDMRWIDRRVTRSRMAALIDQIGPKRNIYWVDTYARNADRFTKDKQTWFNEEVRKLALKHPNVHVVPFGSGAKTSGVRFVDGLHFRAVDYRSMAKLIAEELDKVAAATTTLSPSPEAPPVS
jgi:hypothetical protein